jgi:hypothetical protein
MFRNKIPEPCWIPEEPHQEVWNRTIGAGCGCERGFTSRRVRAENQSVNRMNTGIVAVIRSKLIANGNARKRPKTHEIRQVFDK